MYVSICLFLIFVHLSGESLYIDSNKCAPLPSFLPSFLTPSFTRCHHFHLLSALWGTLDPNTISLAPDAVGHAGTPTQYCQLGMLWGRMGPSARQNAKENERIDAK